MEAILVCFITSITLFQNFIARLEQAQKDPQANFINNGKNQNNLKYQVYHLITCILFSLLIYESNIRSVIYKTMYFYFIMNTNNNSILFYSVVWIFSMFRIFNPMYIVLILILQIKKFFINNIVRYFNTFDN